MGSVLCVSFSALTLMVGWQEGHVAHKKVHFTNRQRFVSGTGGGGHEEELPDPGSPGKAAIKIELVVVVIEVSLMLLQFVMCK